MLQASVLYRTGKRGYGHLQRSARCQDIRAPWSTQTDRIRRCVRWLKAYARPTKFTFSGATSTCPTPPLRSARARPRAAFHSFFQRVLQHFNMPIGRGVNTPPFSHRKGSRVSRSRTEPL